MVTPVRAAINWVHGANVARGRHTITGGQAWPGSLRMCRRDDTDCWSMHAGGVQDEQMGLAQDEEPLQHACSNGETIMKLPQQVRALSRADHLNTTVGDRTGIRPSQCQCNLGQVVNTPNNNGCPPGLRAACRGVNQCVCTRPWTSVNIPDDALQYGPLYKGGEFSHR